MIIRFKNNTQAARSWAGQEIQAGEYYTLEVGEEAVWSKNSSVLVSITDAELILNDGTRDVASVPDALKILFGLSPKDVQVVTNPPFAGKVLGEKKIFSRMTGKKFPVTVGVNILDFLIPKTEMKMNGVEITNGKVGETVNFKVLDTATGAISTIPNFMLNQFAFDVNLPDGFYSQKSNYDADVIKDLVIRIEITAVEARDLCVNYLLHELKA